MVESTIERITRLRRVDQICDDFENSLQIDPESDLRSFLSISDEPDRTQLLHQLLEIQRAYDIPELSTQFLRQLPEFFGEYRVEEILGFGAFGVVVLALDERTERRVAIKTSRPDRLTELADDLFFREARKLSQLRHKQIAALLHCDRHPQCGVYLISEFIDGCSLADKLQYDPPPPDLAIQFIVDLSCALETVHQQQVIHRDIKPSNVILTAANLPVLIDFGLATQGHLSVTTSNGKLLAGTPAYMSPEHVVGDATDMDLRADIYSLGAVLYELLTGRPPLTGTPESVLLRIPNEIPTPPDKLNPRVSRELGQVCMKALAKDRDQRFAAAGDLRSALLDVDRAARRVNRRHLLTMFGAGSTALAAGVGYILRSGLRREEMEPTPRPSDNLPPSNPITKFQVRSVPQELHLTFWPLNARAMQNSRPTAEPVHFVNHPDRVFELPSGWYLVVAYTSPSEFVEVVRYLPQPNEKSTSYYRHRAWKTKSDGVAVLQLDLPAVLYADKLVLCPNPSGPDFLCDDCETTVAEYRSTTGSLSYLQPKDFVVRSDRVAVVHVSFDQAMAYAEQTGKRLLEEWEYNHLVSLNQSLYPWGAQWPKEAVGWAFDEVKSAPWDVIHVGNPPHPIHGLFSNVAEWTMSFDGLGSSAREVPARVIRGGSFTVLTANPFEPDYQRGTDWRELEDGFKFFREGLGFRCAKSIQPRLSVEDFHSPPMTDDQG